MKCLEIFLILLFKGDQHPSCGAGKPTVGFPWRPVFLHQQLVSQWGRDTRQACCGDGRLRFEGSPSALPSFPRTEPQSRPLPSKLPPCLHSFWEEIDPLSGFQGEAHGISNVNEKHQWVEMDMVPRHVFAVEPNSLFRGLPWPQGSTDLPVLPVSLRAHVSCSCQIQSFSRELICNPGKNMGKDRLMKLRFFLHERGVITKLNTYDLYWQYCSQFQGEWQCKIQI